MISEPSEGAATARTASPDDLPPSWDSIAESGNERIRSSGRWRTVRTYTSGGVETETADGRSVVQFASNDYLGLSAHPAVVDAAISATRQYGAGSGASRLITGSRPPHDALETELSVWKGTEDCLLFPTGYSANVGVLGSLARLGRQTHQGVAIVSDELNHASIIDGARLAKVSVSVYPHNDVEAAAAAIGSQTRAGNRCVLVTDSVFSMDGDLAPLNDLEVLAAATNSLLVIDDAHSVFAQLKTGQRGAEILVVGTLSKTLGSVGGFVAGAAPLIDWMRNTARSSIFSTAFPPSAAAAASAALDILCSAEGAALIERLRINVDRLRVGHPSAVLPVLIGDEERTMAVSAALLASGFLVPAIRPPTVAIGSSRLRIAVSAEHTIDQIDGLLGALAAAGVSSDVVGTLP